MNKQNEVIFVKLGGSLITDKSRPSTLRSDILNRLAGEISIFRQQNPEVRLVLGHGSGSFGHVPAHRYGTRQGVQGMLGWHGFSEVWFQAAALNHSVITALHAKGLDAIAFPASAALISSGGKLAHWELTPLRAALQANLIAVIYGDVIFDDQIGGTIYSTEDLFGYLILEITPQRILLAGIEPGVCSDYPRCENILESITPADLDRLEAFVSGALNTDVTGGMRAKVLQSLGWIRDAPDLEVVIFSGTARGNLLNALNGKHTGTQLHATDAKPSDRI